jgi:methionyl aminopeptidase
VSIQKSWRELQSMHRASTIVVETLEVLAQAAVAGTTTKELDTLSRERIVSLDLGCIVDGFYGDAARTVGVGAISADAQRLLKATEESLHAGIAQCLTTKRIGDIGAAVQGVAEGYGYSVVREFVGHGIGTSLHEDPQVPNYGPAGRRERLVPGMCLAIEPMLNVGRPEVKVLEDGWTAVTVDRSRSAHFELAVAVTEHGPWILSEPYPYGREAHA